MIKHEEKNQVSLQNKEQIISVFHTKIKNLMNLNKSNLDLLIAFNGELIKAQIFVDIINLYNEDIELLNLCVSLFSKILQIDDLKLTIKKFKIRKENYEFTKDQKIACRKFVEFMLNPIKKTFGLYGFSGTGKTTTLVEIVTYLLSNRLIKSVVFSAPTNKAVNVMKNKFDKYIRDIYCIYSGRKHEDFMDLSFDDLCFKLYECNIIIEFTTIHKLLNFEFDFDNNGKLCFKKNQKSNMWKYNLIIIDECSMLPAQMIDTIYSDIRDHFDINDTIKIVFSGDVAQLPPVGEKNSIIFSKNIDDLPYDAYLESLDVDNADFVKKTCFKIKYDKLMNEIISMNNFVMKQVVRSRSNNVLGVCNTIRDWALGDINTIRIGKYIDSKDCFSYKYTKFTKKINSDWFKTFVNQCKDKKDAIILTWTNKQCDEYNDEIRKELYFNTQNKENKDNKDNKENKENKDLDAYIKGDFLMLSDFYSMSQNKTDDNKFYTSEQIKVVNLEIINIPLGIFPSTLNKKSEKIENLKQYEDFYKKTLDKIVPNVKKTYKCWKLYVTRLSDKNNETSVIYIIHKDYEKIYETEKTYIENCIKIMRQKLIAKYKEKSSVIDNHIVKYFWKNYHQIYIQPFANVNYGYCITSHKAQGSTFYNVFVDLENIVKNTNENEMKRCLYTALSRTSNELHILV